MIKGTKTLDGQLLYEYTWDKNVLTVSVPKFGQTVVEGFDNFKEAWNHYKLITMS